MAVASRKTPAYTRTDCDGCGEQCPYDNLNIGAHRMWARRHVEKHPTHQVFVATKTTRVYTQENGT